MREIRNEDELHGVVKPSKNWHYKWIKRKKKDTGDDKFLSNLLDRMSKHPNETYLQAWREYYRDFVNGFQWIQWNAPVMKYEEAADRHIVNIDDDTLASRFQSTVNYLKVLLTVAVARHIQNQPAVTAEPLTGEQKDIDAAKTASRLIRRLFSKELFDFIGIEYKCLFNAAIDDIAWLYVDWDPNIYSRIGTKGETSKTGDIKLDYLTASQVYWLTQNATNYFEIREVVIVHKMEVEVLRQEYPKYAESIGPMTVADTRNEIDRPSWENELALVYDYWRKPDDEWKKGRFQRIINKNLIVTEENSPNKLVEMGFPIEYCIPVVPVRWDLKEKRMNGNSAVADLVPLQRELNVTESILMANVERVSAGKILLPDGSNIKEEDWTNLPDVMKYSDSQGGRPYVLSGASVAAYVPNTIERKVGQMQDMLGIHEISQGGLPEGASRISGYAFDRLSDQEGIRHNPNLLALEQSLMIYVKLVLLYHRHFYTEKRFLKFVGERGGWLLESFIGSDLDGDWEVMLRPASLLNRALTTRIESLFQIWDRELIQGKYSPDPVIRQASLEMLKMLEFGQTEVDVMSELQRSRANAMLQMIIKGEGDKIPPILSVDDPIIFIDVFNQYALSKEFLELDKETKQDPILARIETYRSWMEGQGQPGEEPAPAPGQESGMSDTQQGLAMSQGGGSEPAPGDDELQQQGGI